MSNWISSARLGSLGDLLPSLREGTAPTGGATHGVQQIVSIALGPPLLVDSATYKHAMFVAPCNGCIIKEIWISGAVKIASGTNTLAFDNYDASADAARNVLSATNIDPDTITAKEGLKMTLSATASNLVMDEGDVLNATLVCGTQSTAGEGYVATAVIIVPDIL